jgi:hypothetical protein
MSQFSIPKYLLDEIRDGKVILFLGSGFSFGAKHPEGKTAPIGQGLADLMAEKFLGDTFKGHSLMHVSQISISESDIFNVQKYVYDLFAPFEPATYHQMLSTFKWKSIYTTNYDFVVEKSYENKEALQDLSPVYRNTKDFNIFKTPNTLPYYKLHGCLSSINDENTPLILTPEQYITHRNKREMLFEKFFSEAWNHTILFVGFSFSDNDIMSILHELDTKVGGRSRSFFVGPNVKEAEVRFWDQKKISPIVTTFEMFINELDRQIPNHVRKLANFKPSVSLPIHSKFTSDFSNLQPSIDFQNFIDKDVDYIHAALGSEPQSAKEFYKGYFENWDPIIRNLDVSRELTEAVLTEVIVQDFYNDQDKDQWLFVIKGYAGSGKSVLLKRLAWEAAVEYERFCLFYTRYSKIRPENIIELYRYARQRIYLFIDNAMSNEDEIIQLYNSAKKENIPLSIFTTERVNIWNNENNILKYIVKREYPLEYLSKKEILGLLGLLERHNSLGYLESKTQEQQIESLSYKPGYELLVTLYEATQGKPYKDIIVDEYHGINGDKAKSLYLTVSLLHRLSAPARAGLIARVHGISIENFKNELHAPLEYIVFDRYDYRIQDYVYQTRHPYIAELLVENVLSSQKDRFDEYVRILRLLDVGFQNDRIAFSAMINAKKLMSDFTDHELIRKIYEVALINNSGNPKLLQQYAIFALETGEFGIAEKRIKEADEIARSKDPQIRHTFAEFAYKRAENSRLIGDKIQHLQRAIKICDELIRGSHKSPHPHHTILKSNLYLIELALDEGDPPTIERTIKEFEKRLVEAKQKYPYQEFILTVEAKFKQTFDKKPEALQLLLKAHELNPGSPFIVSRLVAMLYEANMPEKVGTIIEKSLKFLAGDKELNLIYAQFLIKTKPSEFSLINHHLGKAYTENDNRHYALYLHAKTLYISGAVEQSLIKFKKLWQLSIDPEIKQRVYDFVEHDGQKVIYEGVIKDFFYSHGWLIRNHTSDEIFFHTNSTNSIRIRDHVSFNLGFNYGGPIAVNVKVLR